MSMKIVTTIRENTSINIKRYENEIKVGERNIQLVDYIYSLMEQLPMGTIMEYIVSNKNELEEYLNRLEEPDNFDEFLSTLLENVPGSWYEDNSAFLNYLTIAMKKLRTVTPDDPNVVNFLLAITRQIKLLKMDSNLAELLMELIRRFLVHSSENKELEKKKIAIFRTIFGQLEKEHKEEIKNIIANTIPHLDDDWFAEILLKSQSATNKKIPYFNGTIPPGVAYLGVNSHGVSYVYDVPKSRIRVNYHDTPIYDVGHPRLLAIYKLQGEHISSMKVVAVKNGVPIHENMEVYEYPYSHVYKNGSVCWSDYLTLKVDMLPHAINLFLSAKNSNHGRANAFELYKENEGKDFDEEKLVPLTSLKELL